MEYYFSGTIERVIFENQSSFFRILLLDTDMLYHCCILINR